MVPACLYSLDTVSVKKGVGRAGINQERGVNTHTPGYMRPERTYHRHRALDLTFRDNLCEKKA